MGLFWSRDASPYSRAPTHFPEHWRGLTGVPLSSLLPHTPLEFLERALMPSKPLSIFCSNMINSTSFTFYLLGQKRQKAMETPNFLTYEAGFDSHPVVRVSHRRWEKASSQGSTSFRVFALWRKTSWWKRDILLFLNFTEHQNGTYMSHFYDGYGLLCFTFLASYYYRREFYGTS